MSQIKVSELAYCRLQVPDLDLGEQFLTDFGLLLTQREPKRRFFRSTDPSPYCYVIEEGPARFLGFAFHAKSRSDLEALAKQHGRSIDTIDAPGGGSRVRLQAPDGWHVDVVFGIEPAEPIFVERQVMNTGAKPLERAGELFRLKRGEITPVKRLAHVVVGSPNVRETVEWFQSVFGMLSSDEVVLGATKSLIGSFLRVDDGDEFVDHHTIFVVKSAIAGLHHISFESQDIDAVLAEHHRLKQLGRYEHMWGIGRHLLGSQIFDYWRDSFGYVHEHWTDSDRLNASAAMKTWEPHEGMISQWGEASPEGVRNAVRA